MKRDALFAVASTAALCGAVLLHGQDQPVDLRDRAGVWRTTTDVNGDPGTAIGRPNASPAEIAALRLALTRLEQAVRATPMLTPPRGFDVHASQRLDRGCPQNPGLCGQAPLPGWIDFDFEAYRVLDGKLTTRTGGPADVEIAFNNPAAAYVGHHAGDGKLTDLSGRVMVGPLLEGERLGEVSILDTGVVILGRNPRPFFVPASREQYLRALMVQAEASSASPEARRLALAPLSDELAALSAEQRRSPAYTSVNGSAYSMLVDARYEKAAPLFLFNRDELAALSPEQRQATPLFIFNPEYFDPALPRTAIQLITVRFLGRRDLNLEGIRLKLDGRPDLLERSPITPERLAFLTETGVDVMSYRVFELTRRLNYAGLTALLAAPAAAAPDKN